MRRQDFITQRNNAKIKSSLFLFLFILFIFIYPTVFYLSFGIFFKLLAKDNISDFFSNFWKSYFYLTFLAIYILVTVSVVVKQHRKFLKGGHIIASSLNARRVFRSHANDAEKLLLNVIDEISLAAGIKSPYLYMIPGARQGINAFAAGFNEEDIVIGFTENTLTYLNRDELQAIVAHEISHIIHEDCRLKMQTLSYLAAFNLFYQWGQVAIISVYQENHRGEKGYGGIPYAYTVASFGFVGHFIAKALQQSISRKREELADAEAIRFTRNPSALASALKKIASYPQSGQIANAEVYNFSHMFFADVFTGFEKKIFSSHPPIEKRIQNADPNLTLKLETLVPVREYQDSFFDYQSKFATQTTNQINLQELLESFGELPKYDLAAFSDVINKIPKDLIKLAKEPYGARGVLLAFFMLTEPEREIEFANQIIKRADMFVKGKAGEAYRQLQRAEQKYHLLIADLAVSSLQELSKAEREEFTDIISMLIDSKKSKDIKDYALLAIIDKKLSLYLFQTQKLPSRDQVQSTVMEMLWSIAFNAHQNSEEQVSAFQAGLKHLNYSIPTSYPNYDFLDKNFTKKLAQLGKLKDQEKFDILSAVALVASHDNLLVANEIEFLRMFAEIFELPMPVGLI